MIIYWSFTDNFDVSQLKERLQLLTLGIGGVGVVCAYVSYSPEIAARYEFLNFLAYVETQLESALFFFTTSSLVLLYHLLQLTAATLQLWCRVDWIIGVPPHAWNQCRFPSRWNWRNCQVCSLRYLLIYKLCLLICARIKFPQT